MEVSRRGRKLGYQHSEETKKKMSEKKLGKRFTKEHRENISIAKKAAPHHFRGTGGPMFGKKHTPEALEKISWTHKGKTVSEESRAKLRESLSKVEKRHCSHCHGMFTPPLFSRWHGENCRHKI